MANETITQLREDLNKRDKTIGQLREENEKLQAQVRIQSDKLNEYYAQPKAEPTNKRALSLGESLVLDLQNLRAHTAQFVAEREKINSMIHDHNLVEANIKDRLNQL